MSHAIRLDRQWDGSPAPPGVGGAARLELSPSGLVLSWDLRARKPLQVPTSSPGFVDGLWVHDVVELFLAPATLAPGPIRYLELEAGAAGHWLALDLADVRVRGAELRGLAVSVQGGATADGWAGRLRVAMEDVVAVAGPRPWRGLVCAALGPPGERVYLTSSALPGERPDFHRPREWALLP